MCEYLEVRNTCYLGGRLQLANAATPLCPLLTRPPACLPARPAGRLMHHLSEVAGFSLKACVYLVFDEADRLFEMGFADQLKQVGGWEMDLWAWWLCGKTGTSCLLGEGAMGRALHTAKNAVLFSHASPHHPHSLTPPPHHPPTDQIMSHMGPSRQTLLFSATMPKALAEFARAGLRDPELVRLDADTKISPDLALAFFTVRCGTAVQRYGGGRYRGGRAARGCSTGGVVQGCGMR